MERLGNAAEMLSCNVNQIYVPVVISHKASKEEVQPNVSDQPEVFKREPGLCLQ